MAGPKVDDNTFAERDGVLRVAELANEARCLWRETPMHDVGIDGQLEYVLPSGEASGRLVAVQVKAGSSYFKSTKGDRVSFSPAPKHADYWARCNIPVILVLHDPSRDLTCWVDARAALRDGRPISAPIDQLLSNGGILEAFRAEGPLPEAALGSEALLKEMALSQQHGVAMGLSFLDLFFQGMTDIARSVYFGMDLFHALLEFQSWKQRGPWSIGPREFAFLDDYVGYLVSRDLAYVDFDAWRHMAEMMQMTGTFVAPLTARGRELVQHGPDLLLKWTGLRDVGITVERSVAMDPMLLHRDIEPRSEALEQLAAALRDADA